jgi:hypothetical protein
MRVDQREHLGQFASAADERRWLHRQVRPVDRLQRRELLLADLVEALRRCEVTEPVHAEVAQAIHMHEISRRLRQQNLTAVAGSRNPRGAMQIDPDVSLIGHGWLTRVQTRAHLDRSIPERFAHGRRSCQSVRRLRERHEECVPLGVHLDAAVTGELSAQRLTVLGQQRRVVRAPLLQQPRRADNVGEQERHSAMR